MKTMSIETIRAINQALLASSEEIFERPEIRPWQYVQMEYERFGMKPPTDTPAFSTIDDAEIWMCLDRKYNHRLRETGYPIAG